MSSRLLARQARRLRIGILGTCVVMAGMPGTTIASAPLRAAQAAASERRIIQPEDIMGLSDVGEVEISPDGRRFLYVTQPTLATGRPSRSSIWIANADASVPARQLTVGTAIEGSPQWSPKGDRIAFLSNRSAPGARDVASFDLNPASGLLETGRHDGERQTPSQPPSSRQLWLISPDGGEAKPLTALSRDVRSFRWSPDGRQMAILASDPLGPSVKAARAAKSDWTEVDTPQDPTRLWILDMPARTLKRIALPDTDISEVSWSPDGRLLAARTAPATGLNAFFYHSGLLVLDARTGAIERTLFKGVYSAGSWSPDGTQIAFTAPEQNTIGIRAFVAQLASGTVRQIGADFGGTIRQFEWAADGALLARAAVRTRDAIFRVDLRTGAFRPLISFEGRIRSFSVANDRTIALSGSQADRAADAWVFRQGRLRLATNVNPQLREWKLGDVEEVSWASSRDGERIYGVLVRPSTRSLPVPAKTVVLAHGGPHESWSAAWQGSWIDWAQMLASHGYVVLLPNPRGSAGQGSKYAHQLIGAWGRGDYQDIADGVDMLVKRGVSDPARLGIGGWSYGGFMSAYAITHDSRFKTAIVGAGVTDLASISLTTDTPDWFAGYFASPLASFAQVSALSPIRAVDHAAGPVLVLHGQDDVRVPLNQGLGFYRGLRMAGKEARMVTYPREPHRIVEFEHQLDIQRRVLAWYNEHL